MFCREANSLKVNKDEDRKRQPIRQAKPEKNVDLTPEGKATSSQSKGFNDEKPTGKSAG
ncbi:hypothetical protein OM427_24975 [Halomonas sp. 18H]|nr:hypothetical protein [Halomonas sp. 18H]MCW4152772.1 hypothetical protein [Halomonas sp. 18H]